MSSRTARVESANEPFPSVQDSLLRLRELSPIQIRSRCDPRLIDAIHAFQTQAAAWDMIKVALRIYRKNKQADRKGLLELLMPGTEAYIAKLGRQPQITPSIEDPRRKASQAPRRHANNATTFLREFADGFTQDPPVLPKSELSDGRLLTDLVLPVFREVLEDRTLPTSSAASQDLDKIFSGGLRQWLVDNKTVFDLSQHLYALERYGCGATIRTFVLVTDWVGNRLAIRSSSRRRGKEAFRRARGKPPWHQGDRCALCEKLTQLSSARASSENPDFQNSRLSDTYCNDHVQPRAHANRNNTRTKVARFEFICEKLWSEIKRDVNYFRRFVPLGAGTRSSGEWHMLQCECRLVLWASDGEAAHELFYDFESNVRSTARLIAEAFDTDLAIDVDRLVQTDLTLAEITKRLKEKPKKVLQRTSIAVARLKSQRRDSEQIAALLGIPCEEVQSAERRIQSLRGDFDFSPKRPPELVWWPHPTDVVTGTPTNSKVYAEWILDPEYGEATKIDLDEYVTSAIARMEQ